MSQNKTQPTSQAVETFLAGVEPERKREEARELVAMFRRITGCEPVMWGSALIGFGSYHYKYESGREGDFLATGFSPRKAQHSIYIMPGYADFSEILSRLGKHSMGKSCLYIKKLADVDMDVLEELVRAGLENLKAKYPVQLA